VRRAAFLLASLALSAVGACGSAPPAGVEASRPGLGDAPAGFRDVRGALGRLAERRAAGDARGARARADEVLAAGKRLVAMERPEDLMREHVARYLEGRARFIDALNAFDRAAETQDDAALWTAVHRLERAFWGWFDAYRGQSTQGAV
jgi:hypothetical protein